jgi:transaldolase
VRDIYGYYKSNGIETIVMGASFRNTGQIEALAGCDRLTIAPALMDALASEGGELKRILAPAAAEPRSLRSRRREDGLRACTGQRKTKQQTCALKKGAPRHRCFIGNLLSQNKPIHDLKLLQRA